uniref:Protein kinase domain-containing protein n=1 Tax=Leersia perrieri TaxID=77586 RepID=A0A0D9X0E3_9ORYZ
MDVRVVKSRSFRPPPMIASAAVLLLLSAAVLPLSQSYTYEQDVFAINGLYTALGSPSVPGWITNGGDPCTEGWQGVECVASNITSITLNGANLGGQLGNTLGNFTSLITLDLSSNNIGGTIPDNLPITLQRFFLSGNQLSGGIPNTLSTLTLLTGLSLNNNHLDGEIPDAFSTLTGLANLHIQNNQIIGTLNASCYFINENLFLLYSCLAFCGDWFNRNIENNLFSGPIPVKVSNIPNFKKDGNPFNTSIVPSALPPAAPTPLPSVSPPIGHVPTKEPSNSSNAPEGNTPSRKNTVSAVKFVGYILVGVVSAVVIVLMVMFCLSKYKERKSRDDVYTKNQLRRSPQKLGEPKIKEVSDIKEPPAKVKNNAGKAASDVVYNAREERKPGTSMSDAPRVVTMKQKEHVIDMEKTDKFVEEPLHPPQPAVLRTEKVTVNPSVRTRKGRVPSVGKLNLTTTAKSFSIASLQQYTNSFSEENLIRDSRFGKLLEVLKIDAVNSIVPVDAFLELVVKISELTHPNILGLVGYCAEFDQRLLVYEHCSKMTLHDELHYVDDSNKGLSWNARLQVAVGAAKALQYLHDDCQPPVVHQNFEPSIVLLNSTLVVHISECGLAALSSKSVSQLSGRMCTLFHYEAPEVHESGSLSDRSDVYSFGVVMLELLTGRKPYDSQHPRAEQHLVQWATSQLYDIDAISNMVDPSIRGQCSEKSLSRFADIISSCIQHEPEFRPPMSEVVQDLTRMVSDATKASM